MQSFQPNLNIYFSACSIVPCDLPNQGLCTFLCYIKLSESLTCVGTILHAKMEGDEDESGYSKVEQCVNQQMLPVLVVKVCDFVVLQ